MWIIHSTDGSIKFECEADDPAGAYQALAEHLNYPNINALAVDLNYGPASLKLTQIVDSRRDTVPDGAAVFESLRKQRESAEMSVFKRLRRIGQR